MALLSTKKVSNFIGQYLTKMNIIFLFYTFFRTSVQKIGVGVFFFLNREERAGPPMFCNRSESGDILRRHIRGLKWLFGAHKRANIRQGMRVDSRPKKAI